MPKDYDKIHRQNLERYSRQIRQLYLSVIDEVSKLSVGLSLNKNNEFYFRNYSEVNNKVNELILELNRNVYGTTVEGINLEWDLAVEKNNQIAQTIFGKKISDLPKEIRENYLSNNGDARRAFVQRKINGLNLSDRVWNNVKPFKKELELSLEYGISNGTSADTLSRQIRMYLNDPNRLYRRVRDEKGVLRLSKAAQLYNPGQGVYRSSYKNSYRATREEINQSYRASEFEKRQQQDFVVGILVETIPGWTEDRDKGGINCGQLAGKYPPTYHFRGNHIQCVCSSRSILKSEAELDKDLENMLDGIKPSKKEESSNYVDGFQDFYKKYVNENKEKFSNWKTPPLFMQDYK